MAAFLVGITLTLIFEIRRRRQLAQASTVLYLLPLISLVAAGGIVLTGYQPAKSYGETAVFISPPFPASPSPVASLPAPQISLHTPTRSPQTTPLPTAAIPETAVRRLSIPALNLSKPVHPIPLENGIWNVAELGSDVGWLETTAVHPDDEQAMVFVGHMTFANDKLLEQGAFADIPSFGLRNGRYPGNSHWRPHLPRRFRAPRLPRRHRRALPGIRQYHPPAHLRRLEPPTRHLRKPPPRPRHSRITVY